MAQNEKELMSVSALTRELHMRTVRKRYDLVICDEFGYMASDKEGG